MKNKIIKIVSGGQTGVDRGGLDAALELGLPHGGWCPKGRLAEDGTIAAKYRLKEATSKAYLRRTELNVKDSSATVVLYAGTLGRGSQKTVEFAAKHGKACLLLDINDDNVIIVKSITEWIDKLPYTKVILNVAGSRGSKSPTSQQAVKNIILEVLATVNQGDLTEDHAEYKVERVIALPFYPDLKIACGTFRDGLSEYATETMEIPHLHHNLDPKYHFLVRASGDSMDGGNAPIKDGELLLFELNTGGTISNQIFAIEYQDDFGNSAYIMKRIVKDAPGEYRLVSTNKAYPAIPVDSANMFAFARFKYKI